MDRMLTTQCVMSISVLGIQHRKERKVEGPFVSRLKSFILPQVSEMAGIVAL